MSLRKTLHRDTEQKEGLEGAYINYLTVIPRCHAHTHTQASEVTKKPWKPSEVKNFTVQEHGDPTHIHT